MDNAIGATSQFQGIIQQQNDYSCGTATIATLLQGLYGKKISEQEVVDIILKGKSEQRKKEIIKNGYSLLNLQKGSTALGYKAMWRKIQPKYLHRIEQPVVLLVGLKSEFPHFVVLKGIRGGVAYLADPIRGNIRVKYKKLVKEGIGGKYSAWYVMATKSPPKGWQKKSLLSLSKSRKRRYHRHVTDTQANIRNMLSLSKKGQLSVSMDYQRGISDFPTDNYSLGVTYGLSKNSEVKASTSISRVRKGMNQKAWARMYGLELNYRNKFDESNRMGAIYSAGVNYTEDYKLINGSMSATVYKNLDSVSLVGGGSVSKRHSRNNRINKHLEDYSLGVHLGVVKPIGNRYSTSLVGSYQVDVGGESNNEVYSIDNSLSYVYDKEIQIQSNLGISLQKDSTSPDYTVGLGAVYLGEW